VTRVGATRTKDILDDCRTRLGLEPIPALAAMASPAGH
jgi:hypothetical protein